jgi:hypothetical protein
MVVDTEFKCANAWDAIGACAPPNPENPGYFKLEPAQGLQLFLLAESTMAISPIYSTQRPSSAPSILISLEQRRSPFQPAQVENTRP